MSFRASDSEFRHRFWVFAALFGIAFLCYNFDHENVSVAIARWIVHTAHIQTPEAIDQWARGFFALGALLVFGAALMRSWGGAYLHSSIVHDRELHAAQLVADGPYRYVRNPLYFGNELLALGMGLLASRTGFVVLVVGVTVFDYRLILCEEAKLIASQGESYKRYQASVPRLLPSLVPRVPSGGGRPNWIDGIYGEVFMWGGAVGFALLAFTLKARYFWIPFGVGLATDFLRWFVPKKPSDTAAPPGA